MWLSLPALAAMASNCSARSSSDRPTRSRAYRAAASPAWRRLPPRAYDSRAVEAARQQAANLHVDQALAGDRGLQQFAEPLGGPANVIDGAPLLQ